uniref:Putative stoned b synaptic vesicle bioproteinsis protein n=1 Tax=Ornithodoros turicata TaxID=34597 RepID=A0A2R5LJ28_9ACAR
MNFIKKKIKGHKKGHDSDDEVEAAIYAKQLAERQQQGGATQDLLGTTEDAGKDAAELLTESKKKESEEWKFFEQLTQRVQDTVQKTQTTLSKIKETSAITELNKPDYILDPGEESEETPASIAQPSKSWVNFEEGASGERPPRPGPPPRPPPPSTKTTVPEDVPPVEEPRATPIPNGEQPDIDLLEEFGFAPPVKETAAVIALDISSSLLVNELDLGVEGDDPFDTSFVDVAVGAKALKVDEKLVNDGDLLAIADGEEAIGDDPFDTSFVDTYVATKESPKQPDQGADYFGGLVSPKDALSEDSGVEDGGRGEEMSNPFLSETQSASRPASRASTTGEALFGAPENEEAEPVPNFFSGRRRSSTNPFETTAEDLDYFKNAMVGGASNDTVDVVAEGVALFEAIATTFPDTSKDEPQKDLFGFDDDNDKGNMEPAQPTFDPFADNKGSNEQEGDFFDLRDRPPSPPITDPFQLAFGKKSVDYDLTPDDKTITEDVPVQGGLFGEQAGHQPSETKVTSAMFNDMDDFFGMATTQGAVQSGVTNGSFPETTEAMPTNKPAAVDSFDPFQDISKCLSATPAVPPAVAAVTPQREDYTLFDLNGSPVEADVAPDPGFDAFQDSAASVENSGFGNFGDFGEPAAKDQAEKQADMFQDHNNLEGLSSDQEKKEIPADTNYDPFDTTAVQLEAVKNTVPITDTAAFEAFAAKFEHAIEKLEDATEHSGLGAADDFDPFSSLQSSAFKIQEPEGTQAFDTMDIFDPFAVATKPPENTPVKMFKETSQDSFDDDDTSMDFSVVIRPKMREPKDTPEATLGPPPKLLPPPKSPVRTPASQTTTASRFNPFDKTSIQKDDLLNLGDDLEPAISPAASVTTVSTEEPVPALGEAGVKRSEESAESPSTPLFDEDTSQPLEEFREKFDGDGWEMMLRHPNKKKITGNRYWKKVYVRMSDQNIVYIYNKKEDNDPVQEVPLQACYSLSEVGAQQFDAYGKIFTIKLQYIFYRERVGVRPGQITKVMQGQVTTMGQLAKLGLPLEHAPQVSQLLKLGTQSCEVIKSFVQVVEDALFHLQIHRDRALTYKTEEIQVTVHDEFVVEQDKMGHVCKQKARVRLFFLAFVTGMPDIEVGVNDLTRQGKEVVGRYDILPVVTEEWIRLENCEFHSCVMQEEFENNRIIKLHPPDACLFELMRFRIRPPRARELPLQLKAVMRVASRHVELRGDVLVPGYHSRKHGQVPCEDIQIRFPIPECWVYLFRVEKHFRYGALKSAARRPGKIKGLERIIGTAQPLDHSLIEVSAGQAKYEHAYKAVIWRIPRLPKEGQGAYTQQLFLLRLDLTSFDQVPETFDTNIDVEFTMPATTVSHTTVRSISVSNENPPEKYVRYISKHEYRVELDLQMGDAPPSENEISSITATAPAAPFEPPAPEPLADVAPADSDSD